MTPRTRLLLLLGAIVAGLFVGETRGEDWNLFAGVPRTYADGEAPTAGLPVIERTAWNLFCPLAPLGDAAAHEEWNFLTARPVAAQDDRPVMECLVTDEFVCVGCDAWQNRGDAGLPVQLKFVVDNHVGDEVAPDGRKKGWPVFRFTDRSGKQWDIFRVGSVEYLVNTWKRLEPGGQR